MNYDAVKHAFDYLTIDPPTPFQLTSDGKGNYAIDFYADVHAIVLCQELGRAGFHVNRGEWDKDRDMLLYPCRVC